MTGDREPDKRVRELAAKLGIDPAVLEALLELFGERVAALSSPWKNARLAAIYLSLKPGQFEKWAKEIPRQSRGRQFVYHVDDLDAWMRNQGSSHGL